MTPPERKPGQIQEDCRDRENAIDREGLWTSNVFFSESCQGERREDEQQGIDGTVVRTLRTAANLWNIQSREKVYISVWEVALGVCDGRA